MPRSIPAYAGDPITRASPFPNVQVYPRLRGGSSPICTLAPSAQGLSPPTRGIRRRQVLRQGNAGSIPAYAGDPYQVVARRRPLAVYPRLRGGSPHCVALTLIQPGLSPPTRGIRRPSCPCPLSARSIPAYAGDPHPSPPRIADKAVYPRLRGGSITAGKAMNSARGLSPPTRGIPLTAVAAGICARSIPAYAGDPACLRRFGWATGVYPRLRGGSTSKPDAPRYADGLSPPTRGIQRDIQAAARLRRSIPAYAGDPP